MTTTPGTDRFLAIGEFFFGSGNLRITTVLGTCVSITLWHPIRRLGGICHYLLPARGDSIYARNAPIGTYAEDVVRLYADALHQFETTADEYVVKMFGGGHMFPAQIVDVQCRNQPCSDAARRLCANVGCRNVSAGRRLLGEAGFAIAKEDVGGHGSRHLLFELGSGDVWVRRGGAMAAGMTVRL